MTFTLHPAGDCIHCGEAINEEHMIELVASREGPSGSRMRTLFVHTESGRGRCDGRDTFAERDPDSPIPPVQLPGQPNVEAAVNYMRSKYGL